MRLRQWRARRGQLSALSDTFRALENVPFGREATNHAQAWSSERADQASLPSLSQGGPRSERADSRCGSPCAWPFRTPRLALGGAVGPAVAHVWAAAKESPNHCQKQLGKPRSVDCSGSGLKGSHETRTRHVAVFGHDSHVCGPNRRCKQEALPLLLQ
jgi:hypothetical protein